MFTQVYSCSHTIQYILCLVHGKGQRTKRDGEQKHIAKKLACFISSFVLSTKDKLTT